MLDTTNQPETGTSMVPEENASNGRRVVMRRAGFGLAGLAAAGLFGSRSASAATVTDIDIFNFALNFEYLGAEYYLRATTGNGLGTYITPAGLTGSGTQGTVTGGSPVPFQTDAVGYYAQQLANDELGHVQVIREVLGTAAIAEPSIDLAASWSVLAAAAGLVPAGGMFDPYSSEINFLLGAYVLEDVCVTALTGAAGLLTDPNNIAYAASILGAEGYQAGLIRAYLAGVGAGDATNAISALRQSLSGVGDHGTNYDSNPFNFTNTDVAGQAYRRTTSQVLAIAYGSNVPGTASGGFFPSGVNGTIRTV